MTACGVRTSQVPGSLSTKSLVNLSKYYKNQIMSERKHASNTLISHHADTINVLVSVETACRADPCF